MGVFFLVFLHGENQHEMVTSHETSHKLVRSGSCAPGIVDTYLDDWVIYGVNDGKYSSTMQHRDYNIDVTT